MTRTVDEASLSNLEEQRDLLLESLRDLERERGAGEIGEDDYRALEEDYTAQAAAVLRAIEAERSSKEGGGSVRYRVGRTASAGAAKRRRSVAVTLVVGLAVSAVAGVSVVLSAGDRDADQPITGSVPGAADVADAISLETEGRAVEALTLYDEILADDPDNVEALAYRGWLLKRAGLVEVAEASLDRAVAVDPTFPDARFFRGMLLYEDLEDPVGGVEELEAFLANDPPPGMVGSVEDVLVEMREAAEGQAGSSATGESDGQAP